MTLPGLSSATRVRHARLGAALGVVMNPDRDFQYVLLHSVWSSLLSMFLLRNLREPAKLGADSISTSLPPFARPLCLRLGCLMRIVAMSVEFDDARDHLSL